MIGVSARGGAYGPGAARDWCDASAHFLRVDGGDEALGIRDGTGGFQEPGVDRWTGGIGPEGFVKEDVRAFVMEVRLGEPGRWSRGSWSSVR